VPITQLNSNTNRLSKRYYQQSVPAKTFLQELSF